MPKVRNLHSGQETEVSEDVASRLPADSYETVAEKPHRSRKADADTDEK